MSRRTQLDICKVGHRFCILRGYWLIINYIYLSYVKILFVPVKSKCVRRFVLDNDHHACFFVVGVTCCSRRGLQYSGTQTDPSGQSLQLFTALQRTLFLPNTCPESISFNKIADRRNSQINIEKVKDLTLFEQYGRNWKTPQYGFIEVNIKNNNNKICDAVHLRWFSVLLTG